MYKYETTSLLGDWLVGKVKNEKWIVYYNSGFGSAIRFALSILKNY